MNQYLDKASMVANQNRLSIDRVNIAKEDLRSLGEHSMTTHQQPNSNDEANSAHEHSKVSYPSSANIQHENKPDSEVHKTSELMPKKIEVKKEAKMESEKISYSKNTSNLNNKDYSYMISS